MIELLTVLGIVAVMAMVALPAYDSLMQRHESQSVARHIQEAIRRAKIEASLHQKDVIVCAINDAGACDRFGQSGLMVFVDKNRNNRPDATDVMALNQPLQLQHGMLSMNVSLSRHYINSWVIMPSRAAISATYATAAMPKTHHWIIKW